MGRHKRGTKPHELALDLVANSQGPCSTDREIPAVAERVTSDNPRTSQTFSAI